MGRIRVAAVVSHPIHYQAPLFRLLSAHPALDLTVYFEHDHGVSVSLDPEFGKAIQFDVPLTEGYRHQFLTTGRGFGRTPVMLARGAATLAKNLKRERYDWLWVHGYSNPATLAAVALARTVGTRVLMRGESTLLYPLPPTKQLLKDISIRALVRSCSAFGYIGDQNRAFYLKYGAKPAQLYFAPYSVENYRFAAAAEQARISGRATELRSRYASDPNTKLCVFVGKLIPRKRPLDVVRALALLPRHYAAIFLGDGPLRAEVEAEITKTGVQAHVVGFVNQSVLPSYHAAADMLVLPSEQETWGLVANEVMACGKPVVSSDRVGSAYDLLAASPSTSFKGAMYPCGNFGALADAVRNTAEALDRDADGVRKAVLAHIAKYDVTATADGLVEAFLERSSR